MKPPQHLQSSPQVVDDATIVPTPPQTGEASTAMNARSRSSDSFYSIENMVSPEFQMSSRFDIAHATRLAAEQVESLIPLATVSDQPIESIRRLTEVRIDSLFKMLGGAHTFEQLQWSGWDSTRAGARKAVTLRVLMGFLIQRRAGDVFRRVALECEELWPSQGLVRFRRWSGFSAVAAVGVAATALDRCVEQRWELVEASLGDPAIDREQCFVEGPEVHEWMVQAASGLMDSCEVYRQMSPMLDEDRVFLLGCVEQEYQRACRAMTPRSTFAWRDGHFDVTYGQESATFKATKGMQAIELLIRNAPRPVAVEAIEAWSRQPDGLLRSCESVGEVAANLGDAGCSANPQMDKQAMKEARDRLQDLQELLEGDDEAVACRQAWLEEQVALEGLLAEASGLGDRLKPLMPAEASKARDRVRKAIGDAVNTLSTAMPQLAKHLEAAGVAKSRGGDFCYAPTSPVDWCWY